MSIALNLRYQKRDQFGSEIFIASNKFPEEKEAFEKLKALSGKITSLSFGTFSPVFYNKDLDYCTIRFKFYNRGVRLVERDTFTVQFVIKQNDRDDKSYVNCHITSIKIHKKATKPVDSGTVLNLF